MLTPAANKGHSPMLTTTSCPICDRKGQCRPARNGCYSPQYGFKEDPSTWLVPTSDPAAERRAQHPDVLAARAAVDSARADFDRADRAWHESLARLHRAGVEPRGGFFAELIGSAVDLGGPRGDAEARRAAELRDAEEEARRLRDEAGGALARANSAHHKVVMALLAADCGAR